MPLTQIRRMLLASVLLCAVFATAACTSEGAKPSPAPTKTAVFASEEDALQAAIDVYQKYSAAYDAYLAGDADRDTLKEYLTPEYWRTYSTQDPLSADELHTEGASTFFNEKLIDYSVDSSSDPVTFAFCRDVTGIRVINDKGEDVTPEDRDELVPSAVVFERDSENQKLRIAEVGSWDDSGICS